MILMGQNKVPRNLSPLSPYPHAFIDNQGQSKNNVEFLL